MKRCLLAVAFTLFVAGSVSAAPIFTPTFLGATGSIFTPADATPPTYDVQGLVMGDVSDPATSSDLGSLWLVSGAAYPSNTLTIFSSDFAEQSSLLFDFTTSMFDATRSSWTVQGLSAPVGVVSDPALTAFTGLVFAQFTSTGAISLPIGTLETFRLASLSTQGSAPIPEPATMGLVGLGLAALGYSVRRRGPRKAAGA